MHYRYAAYINNNYHILIYIYIYIYQVYSRYTQVCTVINRYIPVTEKNTLIKSQLIKNEKTLIKSPLA